MKQGLAKPQKIEHVISECDERIRKGLIPQAIQMLQQLELNKISDPLRARVANLYRRVHLVHNGLTVLRPIVRPSRLSRRKIPTVQDISEYALLLEKIGAVPEALYLLSSFKTMNDPELLFAKAACHIHQWNYEEAELLLKECASNTSDPYRRLIAKVNWVAALVELQNYDQALSTLEECIQETQLQNYQRLNANCLEISAQINIGLKQYKKARQDLEISTQILGIAPTLEPLHIRKWISLIDALEKKSTEPLEVFKQAALNANNLSSVRDTELNILKIVRNEEKLDFLFAGTPLPGFRRHIERELGHKIQKTQFMIPFGKVDEHSAKIDLLTSEFELKNHVLDLCPGRVTFKLFETLLKDFYGVSSVGSLFSYLFPEEYYNTKTSPERVRQVIYRTRKWLKENELPFSIVEIDSCYRIVVEKPVFVKISTQTSQSDPLFSLFTRLMTVFGDHSFSAKEAQEKMKLSYGSWHRFCSWAVEQGYLVSFKEERKTLYKMSQKKTFD